VPNQCYKFNFASSCKFNYFIKLASTGIEFIKLVWHLENQSEFSLGGTRFQEEEKSRIVLWTKTKAFPNHKLTDYNVIDASHTQQRKGVDNRWKKCAVCESSNPPYVMGRLEKKKFNLQGPPQTSL